MIYGDLFAEYLNGTGDVKPLNAAPPPRWALAEAIGIFVMQVTQ